jgi:hypothetical protein
MDKIEYFKRSQELGLSLRCPLVGYCSRWAWSVYFNSYHTDKLKEKETVFEFLKNKNELPSDFESKKVNLCSEPVMSQRSLEVALGSNFCPEIALFSSDHRLSVLTQEAISSFSWYKQEGLWFVEYKHFSECLEFIQTKYCDQSETSQNEKSRQEIKHNTLEITKQELIEFRDFIERQAWRDIFVKDKPQENIARALLQAFLKKRSYREVPVRGGKTDILSFQKEGRVLYETKIWRGEKYHMQGLSEIEEYIKGEDEDGELFAAFYVVFDATKTSRSKSYMGEDFSVKKAGIYDVYTISICLSPPQPSAITPY